MAATNEYNEEAIQPLDTFVLMKHIRSRPAMYIGSVSIRGFMELLKGIFTTSLTHFEPSSIAFTYTGKYEGIIEINGIKNVIHDFWSRWDPNERNSFVIGFEVLNALSADFAIELFDTVGNSKLMQEYHYGILSKGKTISEPINGESLHVRFTLDKEIWNNDFTWSNGYINEEIRAFSSLHKKVKFKIEYEVEGELCKIVYYYKNGLKDRLEEEKPKSYGGLYFETHIDTQLDNFSIEIAFGFREYWVDEPFLRSYVNDGYTHENGTHVDGVLQGLLLGVSRYTTKYNDVGEEVKVTKESIMSNLVAIIQIRSTEALFHGAVKNKLINKEIVEPLAIYTANVLFKKMEEDKDAAKRLIHNLTYYESSYD